jgi:phosphoserine aminotransferase
MARVYNFNPGPAALPLAALERARDELVDFRGSGMSIIEHSHRGKEYEAVHDEAIALVRELLSVSDDYHVPAARRRQPAVRGVADEPCRRQERRLS